MRWNDLRFRKLAKPNGLLLMRVSGLPLLGWAKPYGVLRYSLAQGVLCFLFRFPKKFAYKIGCSLLKEPVTLRRALKQRRAAYA